MLRDGITSTLSGWFEANGQGLVAAWLFGSVARGQERAGSDVDVAVLLGRRSGPGLEDLDRLADMQQADLVQQRFVEHTQQIAIQVMLDVAYAIAAEHNLGEPADHRQVFDRLPAAGGSRPSRPRSAAGRSRSGTSSHTAIYRST